MISFKASSPSPIKNKSKNGAIGSGLTLQGPPPIINGESSFSLSLLLRGIPANFNIASILV